MIAVAEPPQEFIPQGRLTVEDHPGSIEPKEAKQLSTEHLLLQRMQNVNISSTQEHHEFWCIREIFDDYASSHQRGLAMNALLASHKLKAKKQNKNEHSFKATPLNTEKKTNVVLPKITADEPMTDFLVNNEEELYVNKNTVVWSQGLNEEDTVQKHLSFTCDTYVKFAFFLSRQFVRGKRRQMEAGVQTENDNLSAICIIDSKTLHVYCNNGEDYSVSLEFPVSQAWHTSAGLLLEKNTGHAVVQSCTIPMPRLFSLTHPLDEMCPVLIKTATNSTAYMIEFEYSIVYAEAHSDLVLLYDAKIYKHFVSRLRKVTREEAQNFVNTQNESQFYQTSMQRGATTLGSMQQSFLLTSNSKHLSGVTPRQSASFIGRNTSSVSNFSVPASNCPANTPSLNTTFGHLHRTSAGTPLSNLHSTLGQYSFSSVQDLRKSAQAKPAKPVEPVLCLEHLWTENGSNAHQEFSEMAKRAFIHTDLVGDTYMCYLLPRLCRLHLVRLSHYGTGSVEINAISTCISAKDAVCLPHMHMFAVLDPCGGLIIYTGTVLISNVHIAPNLVANNICTISPSSCSSIKSPTPVESVNNSFPRRSSLLPTAPKAANTTFDEELHLLSPVHPLPSPFPNRQVCLSLRDPAGNRLTLVYASGKMLRLSLPLLNETKFITRCVKTLRHVLSREKFLQFIILWYSGRNSPGSRDYSTEQEWHLFRTTLLTLMGCLAALQQGATEQDCASFVHSCVATTTPSYEPKKRRKHFDTETGTDEDWEYLLNAAFISGSDNDCEAAYSIDTNAPLFLMIPAIFFSFHLLYEDFKLNAAFHDILRLMATFLHQLALDMQLSTYIYLYITDFPELAQKTAKVSMLTEEHGMLMLYQNLLQLPAPSVFTQVEYILRNRVEIPYYFADGINELSRNILQLISLIIHGPYHVKTWVKELEFHNTVQSHYPKRTKRYISIDVPRSQQVAQMLLNMDMTRTQIERFPVALHMIIAEALEHARIDPPMGYTPVAYKLILRPDLCAHGQLPYIEQQDRLEIDNNDQSPIRENSLTSRIVANIGEENDLTLRHDGMDNIDTKLLRLRFPDDSRIEEVRSLLTSSDPVLVELVQLPGTSDHEFIEEQEKQLFAICARTMTLSLGRGMFTLRTVLPQPTESIPVPKLCLLGREATKGSTIEMQQIEFPPNMHMWPSFHNGVAAGLTISLHSQYIDSTWIVYNKPKTQADYSLEHAGFLLALGLNEHLKSLSFMSIYDYLVKCDEMTSVGLLLGIAAAYRGTMDTTTTKLLSVHIEALLPATALELDIPQNIQVASLMGIGLLYQGSAKRHIAEVLLQEIGRPPGPEMENSFERESYSLTAGLALGLVTLGHCESSVGLRDLQLPDMLHYYMVGGIKRPLTGSQREKYRLPSFQVREGENVNIDVTAPGATIAIGLMFFNSGNEAIAEWMNPPETHYMLDLVRPDLLMLRTIARGLIMWHEIEPCDWFEKQFPKNLSMHLNVSKSMDNVDDDKSNDAIDYESIAQAYCNVLAGAAFCIGLKYAGTEDQNAFKTIRRTIKEFIGYSSKQMGEYAGRTTIESCLMMLLISISLVFAGSGNVEILRIIRYLRSRIGHAYAHVTYGSHMAIHMSLGLLFLGAGRFTIANTPEAIAALICAFYPKFPIHSNDNRYHLQAFRHLYVLAAEPRLFLPRDVNTHKLCPCLISVLEIGSDEFRRMPLAPCLLPDLKTLQKVIVDDTNYWPVCFERGRNWDQLVIALEYCCCIDVKKRTGCLSHLEDPDRLKSLLAQTLTKEQYVCWQVDTTDLERFSSEELVAVFMNRFLETKGTNLTYEELGKRHKLTMLFHNSVIKDKMHAMQIYLDMLDKIMKIQRGEMHSIDIWQMKLIDLYMSNNVLPESEHILVSVELVNMMVHTFKLCIDSILQSECLHLHKFLSTPMSGQNSFTEMQLDKLRRIIGVVNYYNLVPNIINLVNLSNEVTNYMRIMYELKKLNFDASITYGLVKILQAMSGMKISSHDVT